MRADLEYAMRYSVTKQEDFARNAEHESTPTDLKGWIQKYRYHIIGTNIRNCLVRVQNLIANL